MVYKDMLLEELENLRIEAKFFSCEYYIDNIIRRVKQDYAIPSFIPTFESMPSRDEVSIVTNNKYLGREDVDSIHNPYDSKDLCALLGVISILPGSGLVHSLITGAPIQTVFGMSVLTLGLWSVIAFMFPRMLFYKTKRFDLLTFYKIFRCIPNKYIKKYVKNFDEAIVLKKYLDNSEFVINSAKFGYLPGQYSFRLIHSSELPKRSMARSIAECIENPKDARGVDLKGFIKHIGRTNNAEYLCCLYMYYSLERCLED